jgi:glycosyltransferase involved in cell wall biosynthesis
MALIAQRLVWLQRLGLIFDIRGLMAEEYEDAGRWKRGGVPFRLTKVVERSAIRRADGIVVLTERIRRQLFGETPGGRVHVIPCCADIDALTVAGREPAAARAELALGRSSVMVYVGKFGGWYMAEEMARFFAVARRAIPALHFLILTQGDAEEIRRELDRRGVDRDFTITFVSPERLGRYLAAADFGISFIRPAPSKASSSPTKVGEYLGAGLPTLTTSGVGDLDALISPDIGVLLTEHSDASYKAAAEHIARLVANPDTRERCREVARRELSLADVGIPRYRELYEQVADYLGDPAHGSSGPSSAVSG